MHFTLAAVPALLAVAQAFPKMPRQGNATASDVFVTTTVTALTTFCPSSTTIVQGGKTYTATASQTLTITDCPCTIISPKASAPAPAPTPYQNGTGAAPPSAPAPAPPKGTSGVTVGAPGAPAPAPGAPAGTAAPNSGPPATQAGAVPSNIAPDTPQRTIVTGGASKAGVAVAGVVGAAIALVA